MPLAARNGLNRLGAKFASREAVRFILRDVCYNDRLVNEAMVDEYARPINKPGFTDALAKLTTQYFSPEFDNMTRRYPQLRQPVLAIWGEQDHWVSPAQGKRLVLEAPHVRLRYIPECGHLSQQERPETVNPEILRFLNGVQR